MLIPDGRYPAVVVPMECEDGVTRLAQWGLASTGTRQIVIYFAITEGPYAGLRMPWFGSFTEKSFELTLKALRYCGFVGDDLTKLDAQPLDQQVEITVERDDYNPDRPRSKISFINPPGGVAMRLKTPMSEQDIRAWAGKMKKSLQGMAPIKGPKVNRDELPMFSMPQDHDAPPSNGRSAQERDPFAPGGSVPPDDYRGRPDQEAVGPGTYSPDDDLPF